MLKGEYFLKTFLKTSLSCIVHNQDEGSNFSMISKELILKN